MKSVLLVGAFCLVLCAPIDKVAGVHPQDKTEQAQIREMEEGRGDPHVDDVEMGLVDEESQMEGRIGGDGPESEEGRSKDEDGPQEEAETRGDDAEEEEDDPNTITFKEDLSKTKKKRPDAAARNQKDVVYIHPEYNPQEGVELPYLTYTDLFHAIDDDTNGQVTDTELQLWIQKLVSLTEAHSSMEDWSQYDRSDPHFITRAELDMHLAMLTRQSEQSVSEDHLESVQSQNQWHNKMSRRRWKHCDINHDDKLSFSEFIDFVHPEDKPHLAELRAEEILDDIDQDKNGVVTVNEFLMQHHQHDTEMGDFLSVADLDLSEFGDDRVLFPNGTRVPADVKVQVKEFAFKYDKNNDWELSPKESMTWLFPEKHPLAYNEALHLIESLDVVLPKDNSLSAEEWMDGKDRIMESVMTNFGQIIASQHDEL